ACGARAAGLPCLLGGCTGTDVWSNKTEVSRPSRSPSIRYGTSPALPNASARWKPTCLFEQTAGMFPELVTRPDMQVFLPPIGGTTVYLFGEVEKLDDPRTQVTCRVHDECNGSDVFGSEALKNTFPASDPVSVEQPTTSGRACHLTKARPPCCSTRLLATEIEGFNPPGRPGARINWPWAGPHC